MEAVDQYRFVLSWSNQESLKIDFKKLHSQCKIPTNQTITAKLLLIIEWLLDGFKVWNLDSVSKFPAKEPYITSHSILCLFFINYCIDKV